MINRDIQRQGGGGGGVSTRLNLSCGATVESIFGIHTPDG